MGNSTSTCSRTNSEKKNSSDTSNNGAENSPPESYLVYKSSEVKTAPKSNALPDPSTSHIVSSQLDSNEAFDCQINNNHTTQFTTTISSSSGAGITITPTNVSVIKSTSSTSSEEASEVRKTKTPWRDIYGCPTGTDLEIRKSPTWIRTEVARRSARNASDKTPMAPSCHSPIRNNSTGTSNVSVHREPRSVRSDSTGSGKGITVFDPVAGNHQSDTRLEVFPPSTSVVKENTFGNLVYKRSTGQSSFREPNEKSNNAASSAPRRSSISVLPLVSSLGREPVGCSSSLRPTSSTQPVAPAVSPMDRVNVSFSTATELVASLIGGGRSAANQKKNEMTSFWVPPTVWRKQRAQSLVPQKQASDTVGHEGK